MSITENIRQRTSVRTYTDEPIHPEPAEQIKRYIAGLQSPFGGKARIELIQIDSGAEPVKLGTYTMGWQDNYIKEISFFLDGKVLTSKASTEAVLTKAQLPDRKDYPDGKEGQDEYDYDLETAFLHPSIADGFIHKSVSIKGRRNT